MIPTAWKSAVVAIGNLASAEVDLGGNYRKLMVLIPTLTDTTVTVHVSNASGGTWYPVHVFDRLNDGDTSASYPHITLTGNGGIAVVFDIGGVQFIKVVIGAAEASVTTFLVRGID